LAPTVPPNRPPLNEKLPVAASAGSVQLLLPKAPPPLMPT
jgi:hypothetical protein